MAGRVRNRLQLPSIRAQLLALFALIFAVLAVALVVDEISHARSLRTLQQLQSDALARMRHDQALSDIYRIDVAETAVRVRNDRLAWEAGASRVENALVRGDGYWRALDNLPRSAEQRALFLEFAQSRTRADAAARSLLRILQQRDKAALARFIQAELFPAIDPVIAPGGQLTRIAELQANAIVQAEIARERNLRIARIAFMVSALAIIVLLGRRVLREASRGVSSLVDVARSLQARDYTAHPAYRPRGELGTVMQAFLAMRDDVVEYAGKLGDELARNEQVRQQLERIVQLQQSLLDAAQVAILVIDDSGRWSGFNPFAERLLGWRADEMIGRTVRYGGDAEADDAPRLLPPAEIDAILAEVQQHGGAQVPGDWRALYALAEMRRGPRELDMQHRDGHAVPVEMSIASIRGRQGELLGLVAVAVDLSERKGLEQRLRASEAQAHEANRAKSAFLAAMSHEIRTPLIGITGMIEVLAHTRLDADQRRSLNVVRQSSQSLLQIIGDVLDFSKIEAGRLELATEPASLPQLVRATVEAYSGAASSKGLSLQCQVDERVAQAHRVDALRLRQVLSNLISNAIKFTERGHIDVRLDLIEGDRTQQTLQLSVRDTGIGIAPAQQRRLFEEFSQAEDTTTRRFGGTGLGLAISRRLAELMGGELTLDSAPGAGTAVHLRMTLPCVDAATLPAEPMEADTTLQAMAVAPPAEQAEREGRLVLLVDDHPVNRMVIARQLILAGYACETAVDGHSGLDAWRAGRFGLVLSDVHMPKMDGYALARAIREEEAQQDRPRVPIIALTASALRGEAERCLDAGMDDYLVKPVTIPALAQTLARWLPRTSTAPGADGRGALHEADAAVAGNASPAAGLAHASTPSAADIADTSNATPMALAASAPHASHSAPADVLDPSVLADLGDDTAAVLTDYLHSLDGDLPPLLDALARGDAAYAARQAHRLRGAASIVGACELSRMTAQIEAATRAGSSANLTAFDAPLQACALRVRQAAGKWLADR